ncbi:MAG: helix-turn-helix domain-containing protein [Caldilineaceae bacterium]
MLTFAEQLTQYMKRVGVTDAELARKIGVQRQTIFRWKEGAVGRPRVREDVVRCAESLRLTPEERDHFLLAAGFAPENPLTPSVATPPVASSTLAALPEVSPLLSAEPEVREAVRLTPVEITMTPETSVALLEALPEMPVKLPAARSALRWLSFSWLLIGFVLLVGGAFGFARLWRPKPEPPPAIAPLVTTVQPVLAANGGIVVSQFNTVLEYPRYDVAKRIKEALDAEIDKTELVSMTVLIWPQNIDTKANAETVLKQAGAALIIWGEYDSGRVVANFTVRDQSGEQREIAIDNPNDLNSTINVKVKQEVQLLALLTLGKLYLNDHAYAKAGAAFDHVLALHPQAQDTQATTYFYAGLTAQNKAEQTRSIADYDRAIEDYTKMIALQPALVNGFYNRALSYSFRSDLVVANSIEITRNLDTAIADFTHVLNQYEKPADVHINRGVAYYKRKTPGDLQAALHDFDQAIAAAPRDYRGYYDRALAGIRAGDTLDWQTDLTETLQLNPTYYPAFDAFCLGYGLVQKPQQALAYCEQAVQQVQALGATASMDVLLNRGIVYAQLGRYPAALADLKNYVAWLKNLQPPTLYDRMLGKQAEAWIATLQQAKNPFDQATLAALR